MKRILTILAFLGVASAPAANAQSYIYGWTISGSGSDPFLNSGSVTGAPLTLYLWLQCASPGGMTAAEFDLQQPAGVANFGFTTTNGFLNAGGSTNLLLAVGGCPAGPIVAGSWTVFNTVAGSYCLVASAGTGTIATVDCDTISPSQWPVTQNGYGAGGAASCAEALCTTAVEPTTWGAVKSLYR